MTPIPSTIQSHKPELRRCGSGWGGVWTPRDDFISQRRRTKWHKVEVEKPPPRVPPRVYVDNRTIIREVTDVRQLRKGDHCMVAINLVRSVSPTMDYFVSFLGSIELIPFYHHFIMIDDVDHVDEQGIPRTSAGELAQIVEYANTIPEAIMEVKTMSLGSLLNLPGAVTRFILNKSHCHQLALADYGDTPHLYTVVESLTPEDRTRIVSEALQLVKNPFRYHFLLSNCEHVTNKISTGNFTSPNVHFLLWNMFRMALCCSGLLLLHASAGTCYHRLCAAGLPLWAMVAYHLFATVPVVLQASISYLLVAQSVWRQHAQALIDRDDFLHLMGKELGRLVMVGGTVAAAFSLMPTLASSRQFFLTACGACALAYLVLDNVYNCLAHAVMRLVLLPVWGKVWLIGEVSGTAEDGSPKKDQ